MPTTLRAATREEWPAFLAVAAAGFLNDRPEPLAQIEATADVARTRCIFDGSDIVGTLAAFDFELAIPGGAVRAAGTTSVTVRPTHRRRGLLRQLMSSHLDEVRAREEPVAVLWASESGIYTRFGYGCAADIVSVTTERDRSAFTRDCVATRPVRLIEPAEAKKVIPPLYDGQWRDRPGWFDRHSGWWEHRRFADPPENRQGGSAYRYAIVEDAQGPSGYMQFRVKDTWDDRGIPNGETWIIELLANDAASEASLWRLALDIDLTTKCIAWNQSVDFALPYLLDDPRRATRHVRDALWLRIMDVPTALGARRYASNGDLVLGVRDPFRPDNDGHYRLEGGVDGARCLRTDAAAQIELDISDLGALYLGGRGAAALARAGRVTGEPDAIRRADAMFGWHVAPSCPEVF